MPTYNSATNRYQSLPAGTPVYDANGNVLSDGLHTYSWDAEGKITQIDGQAVASSYDALGRLLEGPAPPATGTFVQTIYAPWALFGPNFALSFGQAVQAAHLVLREGAYAQYGDNAPLNDVNTYWHPDWLGTPRLYSTTTRTMSQDVAYAAFGEQYVGPAVDAFFTGAAESIGANDIKLFPARLYERTAGRWLTPDPAGLAAMDLTNPQSLNRYAYVLGNPLANVDPSGTGACGPGFALTYDPQCQLGPWAQFGSSISAVRSFDPFPFLNSGLTDEQNGTLNSGSFFAGASIASLSSSGLTGGNGGILIGAPPAKSVPQKLACAANSETITA